MTDNSRNQAPKIDVASLLDVRSAVSEETFEKALAAMERAMLDDTRSMSLVEPVEQRRTTV